MTPDTNPHPSASAPPVELTITTVDGRSLGVTDYGTAPATAVLWCHGGPGSRLEPGWLQSDAVTAGLRIIGVDRPGYGRSTPQPARTIADGVDDLLHVADTLQLGRFVTVGVSTGGSYALAAAARAPDRVIGVIACAAMTDMSWAPGRATMSVPHVHAIWDAPNRDTAIAAAVDAYGQGFIKLLDGGMNPVLAPADLELFTDPTWMTFAMVGFPATSTHGLQGYVDDRIADNPGWTTFDINTVICPVTVLHGDHDRLVAVDQAEHTASLLTDPTLVIVPGAGHFSIERHIIGAITQLVQRVARSHPTRQFTHDEHDNQNT